MPASPEVKEIRAAQAWPIRHQVMWPEKPIEFVQLPHDGSGKHFGVWVEGELVSVVSLFTSSSEAQFRKFATLPAFQKRELGKLLLQHVFAYAKSQNLTSVWCDAQVSAIAFYEKAGMSVSSILFSKNGKEYVKMEKILRAN